MDVWTVFVAASVTALATGLGALPFFFFPDMSRSWLGLANSLASGFMLGASAALFWEGARIGIVRTVGGALLGVAFIELTRRRLGRRDDELHLGALRGADATKALLIVGVMTVHSFTEGVGVGVSFGGGEALGAFITAAIAVHNIPEGLAISLVLVPRGVTALRAAGWSIFSSLPQPLMAVPAFLLVEWFEPVLPIGLGFAGGAMVWMVAKELVPEAREDLSAPAVAGVVAASTAAMVLLQVLVLA
ncbi:MAG TPA: ZIP family metal transporter [Gaiellaceae bacterium]|nr:ZIP family metal transporter [Gaiellaceae bacterium]